VFARLSSPCYFSSSCRASCIRDGVFFYARLKNQRQYRARLAELPRQKQLAVNCRQIRILSSSIPSFSAEISKSLGMDLDELTMRVPRIENNLKHISPFGVEASVVFISLGRARTRLRTCNHVRNIYQREQALVNRGFIRLNDDRSKSSYDAHYVFPRAYIRARASLASRRVTNESIPSRDIAHINESPGLNTAGRYETRDVNDINYYPRPGESRSSFKRLPFAELPLRGIAYFCVSCTKLEARFISLLSPAD